MRKGIFILIGVQCHLAERSQISERFQRGKVIFILIGGTGAAGAWPGTTITLVS
jgi:hypothetical protein